MVWIDNFFGGNSMKDTVLNEVTYKIWNGHSIYSDEIKKAFDKLESIENNLPIIESFILENGKKLLHVWGPAGNISSKAKVIISGFSTSTSAAKEIFSKILSTIKENLAEDISCELRNICSNAVYKGPMLKRLAEGMKKIVPIIDSCLDLDIATVFQKEWNILSSGSYEREVSLFNSDIDSSLILTQSTFNGLILKDSTNFSCAAYKIPISAAKKIAIPYIQNLFNTNKESLKICFVLGKQAWNCWDEAILSNVSKLPFGWWNDNSVIDIKLPLLISLPHPSPGSPQYFNIIRLVEGRLKTAFCVENE